MVSWIVFALLYPAVLALVNILDKFLMDKRIRDYRSICLVIGFVALAGGLLVALFSSWKGVTHTHIALGLISGMLIAINYPIYFKVLSYEEVSRVISIFYAAPIAVTFFAAIALGEHLPAWKYAAIALATAGAVLIGMDRLERIPVMRKGFWLIILMCVLVGIVNTIGKYLLADLSIWNLIALETLGISSLMLYALSRGARKHVKHTMKSLHLIIISEYSTYIAWTLWAAATAVASVSLVTAMGSIQPLYVLVLMILLSVFKPKILKEVFTKKTLTIKIVSVLMIVIGTFLVAL